MDGTQIAGMIVFVFGVIPGICLLLWFANFHNRMQVGLWVPPKKNDQRDQGSSESESAND